MLKNKEIELRLLGYQSMNCEYLNVLKCMQNSTDFNDYADGLVQDCNIAIANVLEIFQFWTKPSMCPYGFKIWPKF